MICEKVSYSNKQKAHFALRTIARAGKMMRLPCEVCGNPKTQGHHADYSKPLEVNWLCSKHHAEVHAKYSQHNPAIEIIKLKLSVLLNELK